MNKYIAYFLMISILAITACEQLVQPIEGDSTGGNVGLEEVYVESAALSIRDTVYVPIYSDIYSETKDIRFNLTATLSVRNTSLSDTIYIEDIDYYNSNGDLVRHYLEKILLLKPMQSIEYVIEEEDTEGGTGANFIVNWGTNDSSVKPIFQGIMISTNGQQGISFMTNGVSISKN